MRRFPRKKTAIYALITTLAAVSIIAAANPGSDSDPLISKSYIDEVLMPKIESMIGNSGGSTNSGTAVFEVVSLSAGQTLFCEAGCEMIIRMGNANIVATAKGGIADVTAGVDLPNAASAPSNHLLIVPVGDGRGLLALNDMLVMVKGQYSIK